MKLYALAVSVLAAGMIHASVPQVTVMRTGRNALVRCSFNDREDLVIDVKNANEDAYLISKGTPLAQYKNGRCIHYGTDDFSAIRYGP